ncbi:T9SS type A sorting domain-containing protein [Winogradskyella sp.]|uniref:T9SS type A sorting domain-containing protein n=1 Tax=Winogradskyella sp. TaxID=1883156 RepID=UPI0026166FF4|nr:T9SS type A sorting domain-containing protein [uncultured Winogradskyella sp.]
MKKIYFLTTFLLLHCFVIMAQTVTASDYTPDAITTYTFTYVTDRDLGNGSNHDTVFYINNSPDGYPSYALTGTGDDIPNVVIEIDDVVQNNNDFYRIKAYYGFIVAIGTDVVSIPSGSTIKITIPDLITNPSTPGNYTWQWRTSTGSGHESVYFDADININTLSTNEISFDKQDVLVYPNPASNEINIKLQAGNDIEGITIYNVLGNKVKFSNKAIIDINDLEAGSYFTEIITSKGKVIKKLIVN